MLTGGSPTTPPTSPSPSPSPSTPPANTNLLAGRTLTETSHADVYSVSRANDGDPNSYWESANNAFPQSLGADLGSQTTVSRLVLRLPAGWGARTETLSVLTSTDGNTWSTAKASAGYGFDPATGNTVTVAFPAASARHLRVTFTGNTGWPAAQLSDIQAYAS
ncbi:discoidin domain-containing protein [Kitasatospora sp. NPDC101801]|uniref:discoidin domain-containing protein n=1 Tax=Kitasatospora sp. NPDC101801 TaxID=3364103 RepID=UPI0037FD42ED